MKLFFQSISLFHISCSFVSPEKFYSFCCVETLFFFSLFVISAPKKLHSVAKSHSICCRHCSISLFSGSLFFKISFYPLQTLKYQHSLHHSTSSYLQLKLQVLLLKKLDLVEVVELLYLYLTWLFKLFFARFKAFLTSALLDNRIAS